MKRPSSLLFAIVVLMSSAACGSDDPQAAGGGGAGGSTGSMGGAGGTGGSGGGTATPFSLFDCNLPLTCGAVVSHTSVEPASALYCQAQQLVNDTPSTLLVESRPGPGNFQADTLAVLLGDGTAILQSRSRVSMDSGAPMFGPWTVDGAELCQLMIPSGLAAACATPNDPACAWYSGEIDAADCSPVVVTACDGSLE